MTKSQLRTVWIFALIALLGTPVLAAPRVGLLTLEKGKVTVDGHPLRTPVLLEEGQTVFLEAGARAKVKILGSTQERILEGELTLEASKSTLEKGSRPVQRGAVALAQDMGNVSKGAASVTRSSAADKRTDYRLMASLPQEKNDSGDFEFLISEHDLKGIKDPIRFFVNIAILKPRPDAPSKYIDEPVYSREFEHDFSQGPLTVAGLSNDIAQPGQIYRITVTQTANSNSFFNAIRPYRILTPEERDFLKELDSDARFQADDEQSIYPLLHLASVYNELDQVEEALSLLKEILSNPTMNQEPDSEALKVAINAEITRLEGYLPSDSPALSSTPE